MPLQQTEPLLRAEGRRETERRMLWARFVRLLGLLPEETRCAVCSWLRREYGLDVTPEDLAAPGAPAGLPTPAIRRVLAGLEGCDGPLSWDA